MKEILSVILIFVFGIVFSFLLSNRVEEMDNENNLVQNYSYNCEIYNN